VTDDLHTPEPTASTPASVRLPARPSWPRWAGLALAVAAAASLMIAWQARQRVADLESELVRRQAASQDEAAEARLLARQASDAATQATARLALLDARLAETTAQRTQVEDLLRAVNRNRGDNVLGEIEASVRIAMQQSAVTASVEPLVALLKQVEDRLKHEAQPQLEPLRLAIARDLDRISRADTVNVPALSLKIDDVVRQVDELPLLSEPHAVPRRARASALRGEGGASAPTAGASAMSGPASAVASASASAASGASAAGETADGASWFDQAAGVWDRATDDVWQEVRHLLRVTRVDEPDALLLAPDQAFFARENLKLRLLNARLALLSRQFRLARLDLTAAQQMLDRYFDAASQRVRAARTQLDFAAQLDKPIELPRPDDTLTALSAAAVQP